jgi:hypothetical protein
MLDALQMDRGAPRSVCGIPFEKFDQAREDRADGAKLAGALPALCIEQEAACFAGSHVCALRGVVSYASHLSLRCCTSDHECIML